MASSAEIRQQLLAAMGSWFPSSLGLSFILERSSTLEANPTVLCLRWITRPAPSKLGHPGDCWDNYADYLMLYGSAIAHRQPVAVGC